jgi:biotin transport system substrate-specific component
VTPTYPTTTPLAPKVLADLLPRSVLVDTALVVGAAGLVGALAQWTIPFTPVPLTGQTLGVLLAGTALGWRRGALAMSLYLLGGLAGIPWFADHNSGYVGATFGYIVGFVVAGAVAGWLASRGNDRHVLAAYGSMAVAEAIIYLFGVSWLKVDLHVSWSQAIAYGFTPFILGDLVKAALAGLALPSAWRLVARATQAPR